MGIFEYLGIVVIVGIVVALIQWFAPIDAKFKALALWVGIGFCVLVLLFAVGLLPIGRDMAIPRVR